MKVSSRQAGVGAVVAIFANAAWDTYCVSKSAEIFERRVRSDTAVQIATAEDDALRIGVVVPMLHEADSVAEFIAHWSPFVNSFPLVLCVITTERESVERPSQQATTWQTLHANADWQALVQANKARHLHYGGVNRTYGEQLAWGIDQMCVQSNVKTTHVYVSNADSRLTVDAVRNMVEIAASATPVAQQSAVFLTALAQSSFVAAGEALFQSRWTFEREVFRYLAGDFRVSWLPRGIARRWYQHAVGHGLLVSVSYLQEIGGLPRPRFGLEDAAFGFRVRAHGGRIVPFSTLEFAAAPTNVRELQRQRSTWVRGPLSAFEYGAGGKPRYLVAQGLYDGLKWSLGLPFRILLVAVLPSRLRIPAMVGFALGSAGPMIRLLVFLASSDAYKDHLPRSAELLRAVLAYPLASVSYWVGGFRGLVELVWQAVLDTEWTQARTREVIDYA